MLPTSYIIITDSESLLMAVKQRIQMKGKSCHWRHYRSSHLPQYSLIDVHNRTSLENNRTSLIDKRAAVPTIGQLINSY